jgi:tetratricopeptide (TPR) repeat protein
MEAMAMGLPAIATRWSGHLEFMTDANSCLIDYKLVDIPADHWMRGHAWAEPSVKSLRRALRRLYTDPSEAAAIGRRAREDVLVTCAPERVAEAVRDRLETVDRHPVHIAVDGSATPTPTRPVIRRQRVTACVVVDGTESFVPTCLKSVEPVADSALVIEAGSRNDALDQADEGWILALDATHTLDPASVDVVRELVAANRFMGYAGREVRQVGFDGAVSAIQQWTAALFPANPDLRYVGYADPHLLPRRPALGFRLVPSQIVLRQHDYRRESVDPVARARRDLPILERAVKDEPDEPFHLFNLGVALGRLGLADEADVTLKRAIEGAPAHATWVAPAYLARSSAVAAQGERDRAVKLARKATDALPEWAEGWCALGAAFVDAGRPEEALDAYQHALDRATDSTLMGGEPDDTEWQVRAGIGRIHLARGEYGEAANWLRDAASLSPMNEGLRVGLAAAYEHLGMAAEARAELERALSTAGAGAGAYAAYADFFTRRAEDALLRGLADNPENRALLERVERLRAARALS